MLGVHLYGRSQINSQKSQEVELVIQELMLCPYIYCLHMTKLL